MDLVDLRPSLPVAEKLRKGLWVINGVRYNFVMPLNKYGVAAYRDEVYTPDRAEIIAKYPMGRNWLVAVFLPCSHTI